MSKPNKPENPATAPALTGEPEQNQPQPDPKADNKPEAPKADAKKVIRTLYFSEGFWCKELNQSFQIGYYIPKDEKEAAILQKFAGKENNYLKPSM